ncbi:MAG TPA: YihY/virulence factor BrkB family protein [Opitutales bacterium]|nr:YihY/virulence factor BrkB family protein [Opitutales bacterium]
MRKWPEIKINDGRKSLREWFMIFRRSVLEWIGDEAFFHSAALGFYTLFSLAPILIIAVAVAGFVFGPDAARGEVSAQFDEIIGSESARLVENLIRDSSPQVAGSFQSIVGFVLMVVGATTVFHQLQRSLNSIWGVVAKPSRSSLFIFLKGRVLSLALVLTIGFLLLVSLVLSTLVTALIRYASGLIPFPSELLSGADFFLSLIVFTLLFGMIFKVLPDVKIRWKACWKGAFLTAVLFSTGRYLIAIYLSRFGPASTYGAAGALVVVIFWVYYSGLILLFGAEFIKVYTYSRGIKVLPKATAARVHRRIIEE